MAKICLAPQYRNQTRKLTSPREPIMFEVKNAYDKKGMENESKNKKLTPIKKNKKLQDIRTRKRKRKGIIKHKK